MADWWTLGALVLAVAAIGWWRVVRRRHVNRDLGAMSQTWLNEEKGRRR